MGTSNWTPYFRKLNSFYYYAIDVTDQEKIASLGKTLTRL